MFNIEKKFLEIAENAMQMTTEQFKNIEKITEYNQQKMLKSFIDCGVSESHFTATTGYGYGDRGREILDKVYASVFGSEKALVRHNFVSGTHAITVALFGILRPGDTLLSVTGKPYDTLCGVIGLSGNGCGSLNEFNINYKQVDFLQDGTLDFEKIEKTIDEKIKMVYIQRSRGYTLRPSLTIETIEKICKIAKQKNPNCIIMVDNCYGEFVEKLEPTQCGADLMAGSLIKNPGGGIAPTGGYIAGKKILVEMCAYRLTTPGTGENIGATLGQNRELFLGAFNAPHITGQALKTAIFASAFFELLGFKVSPKFNEPRTDIIEVLELGSPELLIKFCQSIQAASPVDSFVIPEPWLMPGYDHEIIMSSGAFTMGSSIELSADAPIKKPYAAFMQGGFNFDSAKIGIMLAAQNIEHEINSNT